MKLQKLLFLLCLLWFVIFIVVRSSDRGDLVENQAPKNLNLIPLFTDEYEKFTTFNQQPINPLWGSLF